MKKLAACFVLTACIAKTAAQDPAGAAGFTTAPSAASRGETFTTDDGWSVRFEELVLQGWVNGTPESDRSFSLDSSTYRWNARDAVELHATALLVAPWHVYVELVDGENDPSDPIIDLGVDPKLAARFAENPAAPPVAVAIVSATRGPRTVRMDIVLPQPASSFDTDAGARVDVKENALVDAPLVVNAEALFAGAFEPFAAADSDADGQVTEAELASAGLKDVLVTRLRDVVGEP